jgi:hypothetical protein
MALERRDNSGGAVDTTITATINSTDLTIPIQLSTGWPSGGASGPFFVIIDYDQAQAGREKVEIASRTGTTLTVASVGKRGIDDTTAQTHQSGAKIRHCFTAQDADEANRTMSETIGKVTTKGDQIVATGANAFGRLPVGSNNQVPIADSSQATGVRWGTLSSASLAADSVGSTQIAADSVGTSEIAPDAVTATEIAADAVGTSEIAPLAVTAAEIAADTITAGQIAANAIGSSELADSAIDDENLFGANLSPIIDQDANPGAVGARRWWFNSTSTKLSLNRRNAANTGWEVMQGLVSIPYTPTLFDITIGNGTNEARYTRHGGLVTVNGMIILGSTSVMNSNIFGVGLPVNAKDHSASMGQFYYHGAARAFDGTAGYAGVGIIRGGDLGVGGFDRIYAFTTAGSNGWTNASPFAWGAADGFTWFAEYEPASLEDTNYV